ncbi:MAG: polysaccharide biosynthesis protein [Acidimicrobiales bacterium]
MQVGYDALCWAVALWFATLVRYDLDLDRINAHRLLALVPLAALAQLLAGLPFGLYRGRWAFGSFDEVLALAKTTVLCTGLVFTVNVAFEPYLVPRSAPVGAGFCCLVLMGAGRFVWRLMDERRRRPNGEACERLLVFGAGEGASQVLRAMLRNPGSPYLPVGLLDDDSTKRNLRIMGVRVVGNRAKMPEAATDLRADTLLIAIPSASASLVTELSELATACGLSVKVLPPVSELLGGKVGVSDIRDLTAADLLGRHEIRTDVESIASYVTGKRVMVTGAGGSIGSELCRQIYRFAPAELIMVDRDESALHGVQLSIEGRALLDSEDLVLLDLRDRRSVERLIAKRRPDVIFHAAALKHLPLLERHPSEAVQTNVWGTLDLLELATTYGVGRFVNISTDKAADPCSVLGYSKRITERLTSFMASQGSTICLSVRFGNVLGSRGSVLTTFNAQIERGGPLTVTHPDVTRYFMTIEEAVELVIQAGAIGGPGEVLVLDMGKPVRIAEVAQLLAARSDRPIATHFTGLRPGEKLHECLVGSGEQDRRPLHPLISQVAGQALDPLLARRIDIRVAAEVLVRDLEQLCLQPAALGRSTESTGW